MCMQGNSLIAGDLPEAGSTFKKGEESKGTPIKEQNQSRDLCVLARTFSNTTRSLRVRDS